MTRLMFFLRRSTSWMLQVPRLPMIVRDTEGDSQYAIVLVNVRSESDLPRDMREKMHHEGWTFVSHTFHITYDYWTADQIFRAVLPGDKIPSSFTKVGHIAHLNLQPEFDPYKSLIGQVILDKYKNITTVVNKTTMIDNTYRNFQMEVLAGEDKMVTTLSENGCRFMLDFSKVYWNSRLQHEHDRLVRSFAKGSIICDVFAGVGPFAIPACKKQGCKVYANDLNPASVEWLNKNIALNKMGSDRIRTYNMDGRAFIRESFTMDDRIDHYIMNLPAIALEFLDAFRGLGDHVSRTVSPMIHCYCFTRGSDPLREINQRIEQALGNAPPEADIYWVRTVAPKKEMYCVSFRLHPALREVH
ncbi:Met-10+ like-protein-domain-containing protein [Syncephalastrum racemosum]|uniref:tRNA (guanine(37)-N1)-methyltransferase n=1 Tax=Syncephalastrum racemosum TaxID=13706 RepID=A0A1X2HJA4_SYNRA|nr:Met-10+ like-protein-domain-containing protein [Syncephalastrum racemosum]